MVSNGSCASANSSTGTVTVDAVSVGGSISGSTAVCTGTNSTTLTLSGHTGTITKWQSATSSNFITNLTNITNTTTSLTATNLTTTTYYRAVLANGSCSSANSSSGTVTVNSFNVGGTSSGVETLCAGTIPSNSIALSGNTGNVIKWQSALDAAFTNTLTDIASTSVTLTVSNIGVLNATTYFRAVVQSGSCAAAYSSTTIKTVTTVNTGSVSGASTICIGAIGATTTLTLSGNTGTIRWQSSTDNVTFANVGNNTLATFAAPIATAGIIYYRVNVTNGGCIVSSPSFSLTVSPTSVGGTITGGSTICSGSTSASLTLSGHTGTITKWQSSVSPFSTWTDIANTATTYTSGALTATTQFIAVVQSGSCTVANSVVTTVNVSAASIGGTVTGGSTICSGSTSAILTLTGHTGTITKWQSSISPFSTWTDKANTATTYTSEALTATTQFRAVIQNGSCAVANSVITTVTVSPASVGGTIAGGLTVCTGVNSTTLTLSGYTGTIIRWESSLDNFATAGTTIANTTAALTVTNLLSTTYYRAVLTSGVCASANSATATVTVSPASVGSTVSGNQTICVNSQPADITLSGNVGSVVKWQKSSDAVFTNPIDIASTSTTLTGALVGAISTTTHFRAVVQSGACLSVNTNSITVSIVTTTWNGTAWDNGAPTDSNITKSIVLAGNYSSSASLYGCVMQVANNAIVIINSGHNITLNNSLTVDSGSNFTLNNNSNLIQTNDVANTGNITVKRDSALLLRLDHTLWSSPVTGSQTLQQFSPATLSNRFYTYTTSSNTFTTTPATSLFTVGKGYAIRAENTISTTTPTLFNGSFVGVPNNGNVSFTLATDGLSGKNFNLVGNPYPSTIDVTAFLDGNRNVVGTIYFYTHSLTMSASGIFPQGTNYSSRNRSGHTVSTHIEGDLHPQPTVPNGTIQVGQGFLVKSLTGGNLTFTNAMRTGNNDNQFLRTAEIEKHRIWLNLKTDTGTDINQMMVGYIEGATQAVDNDYDGLLFGNTGSSLSSKLDGAYYGIQGRSLPFDSNDIVPLSFKASATGNYMISLTNTDGLFAGSQDLFVRDNLMGIDHNIKVSPYTFASDAGTFDSRFELVYTQALGIPSTDFTPNSVIVYKNTDWFHVNTKGIVMKDIQVYDIAGRLIYKQSDINATKAVLTGLTETNEVLFLKITSEDNVMVTVKVIN